MTSSALLNMEALSIVMRCPIVQLGWTSASASVARASRSSGQSRSAPPDAVSTMRSTAAMSSPVRA